jgi:hypothetical protein
MLDLDTIWHCYKILNLFSRAVKYSAAARVSHSAVDYICINLNVKFINNICILHNTPLK